MPQETGQKAPTTIKELNLSLARLEARVAALEEAPSGGLTETKLDYSGEDTRSLYCECGSLLPYHFEGCKHAPEAQDA